MARLTELGWEAEDVTAYRTVRAAPPPAPIREAIKGGGFDAVLFTSSSTVRNLIGIAGKPHSVTVIAVIGPQTAKTAAEFGLQVDVTADKPSMAALVDAMAAYGASMRAAAVENGEPVRRPKRAPPRLRRPAPLRWPGATGRYGRITVWSAGYPVVRPRRLRRTPALRRLWSPRRRCGPWRAGAAAVRQGGPGRAGADRLDAGSGPAHQGQPA